MHHSSFSPIARQVALIAGLRFRLAMNSLRTPKGQLEFLAKILLMMTGVSVAMGGALGFFLFGLAFRSPEMARLIQFPMWAIFGTWFVLPLFLGAYRAEFEFRNLLRFPLRYSSFYLLSLAYGLFDFTAVLAVIWLAAFGLGLMIAKPAAALWTLLVLAAYAGALLFLSCVVSTWLQRLLGTRKSRERFTVLVLLAMISLQFIGPFFERWHKTIAPFAQFLKPIFAVMPPALAADGLQWTLRSEFSPVALVSSLGLVLMSVALAWILHRRLHAQYLGEDLSETVAPAAAPRREIRAAKAMSATGASFILQWLRDPVAALVEKELRYLWRNSMMLFNLFTPIVLVVFFSFMFSTSRGLIRIFSPGSALVYPAAAGYGLAGLLVSALNTFGFDGRGVQFLFVAPVRFREVLLAKNITLALVLGLESLLMWPLVSYFFSPPPVAVVVATWLAVCFGLLLNCTVGNLTSLYFPRVLEFGTLKQKQAGMVMLINFPVQIFMLGTWFMVFWLAKSWDNYFAAVIIFLVLCGILSPIYSTVLNRCSLIAAKRRDEISAELCKP